MIDCMRPAFAGEVDTIEKAANAAPAAVRGL
jgi:hypothetical protein